MVQSKEGAHGPRISRGQHLHVVQGVYNLVDPPQLGYSVIEDLHEVPSPDMSRSYGHPMGNVEMFGALNALRYPIGHQSVTMTRIVVKDELWTV